VQGDRPRVDARSLTAAATEEKIRWIRESAGDRFGELELNTYPSGGPTVVTDDPSAEARRRADRIREQTGVELTVEEILDSPHMFIGSIKDLTRKFADCASALASAHSSSTTWMLWRQWCKSSPDSAPPPRQRLRQARVPGQKQAPVAHGSLDEAAHREDAFARDGSRCQRPLALAGPQTAQCARTTRSAR
jgi:hypothetical protein